ncbi:hypothetical protein BpHYR1_017448 [Brachionus plicatilis]|uniref:Uncharacterized protein n=1 Tax=Brachionus plicatilis TaxID=10195 RepID=A0A3M7R2Z8_BRAPC|nr:hypothetical protein BpHYR1_017448 [Brachionus plicatilis]
MVKPSFSSCSGVKFLSELAIALRRLAASFTSSYSPVVGSEATSNGFKLQNVTEGYSAVDSDTN